MAYRNLRPYSGNDSAVASASGLNVANDGVGAVAVVKVDAAGGDAGEGSETEDATGIPTKGCRDRIGAESSATNSRSAFLQISSFMS